MCDCKRLSSREVWEVYMQREGKAELINKILPEFWEDMGKEDRGIAIGRNDDIHHRK